MEVWLVVVFAVPGSVWFWRRVFAASERRYPRRRVEEQRNKRLRILEGR